MTELKKIERRARAIEMARVLKSLFPSPKIALNYKNEWELLVAVILSAQCTDKRVNIVTKDLFEKYKNIKDYSSASVLSFEKDIKPVGFYKTKAKNILSCAKIIETKFSGKIPKTMEGMISLPGVARKTANVVLGVAFGKVFGIAVDTHVKRFAQKFDLSDSKDPKKIETDLMEILPKKEWFMWTYRNIEYGRNICIARKHGCREHALTKIYPKAALIWPKSR